MRAALVLLTVVLATGRVFGRELAEGSPVAWRQGDWSAGGWAPAAWSQIDWSAAGWAPAAWSQIDWSAAGWAPAADWRTLEVPGYRLHFPAPAEPWARHLAARLPAVRERMATAVGWDASELVEVILADPIAQPNGAAWPLLGRPRLVLLLTPPSPSSSLAGFGDWPELLATHEQAHLSHLLRPSRQPWLRRLRPPVGPVALAAPRWVVEGYATLVEGRLTGGGRPPSPWRAAVLRRWAQRGQLPTYGALASDSRRYLGQSMAYLAGSAFLEWLERRGGEGSLDRLWRRLTARQRRGFDDAFEGVFGEPPATLWGRFTAELTWQAVEVERSLGATRREGEPWLERSWGSGRPALSRDGSRLVLALSARDEPTRLAVYATTPDEAAARRAAEAERRLLARDPEDVAAVGGGAPARMVLRTLELDGTTVEASPRFLADGSVLFARSLPDAEGTYRADLFRWRPDDGRVARVTRHADLRAPDPAPDGRWAVAVESRWGQTRLVRVDLADGAVTGWSAASVAEPVDAPRLSPDGRRLAFLRHRGDGWELVVRDLPQGDERVLPTPPGTPLQDLAWAPAGESIYATVGEGGLLDVQELPLAGEAVPSARLQVTRSLGAALAPEPTPDGKALFFLALEPEGLQVRRLDLAGAAGSVPAEGADPVPAGTAAVGGGPTPAELYPALPPAPAPPPPLLPLFAVPPSRPYGRGQGEWSLLSGGAFGAAGSSAELGVRGGDVVGRWDLLGLVALSGAGGAHGGAVAGTWRGSAVELSLHAYDVRERPSAQRRPARVAGTTFELDLDARGAELAAAWRRQHQGGALAARLAAGTETLEPAHAAVTRTRRSAALLLTGTQSWQRGRWQAEGDLDLSWQAGATGGEPWDRRGARLALDLGHGGAALALQLRRQEVGGRPTAVDRLRVGGLPTSLLPALATANCVFEPALPSAALVGHGYEGHRVALALPGLPLQPFWSRHRVETAAGWDDWLSLAGVGFDLALPPLPLLELPAADLRMGAAYLLDEPYRGDVNGWVALTWRP